MRKVYALLVCLLVLGGLHHASALSTSAGSAILTEAETGAVLYEHDADKRRPIASTTKIMTGLLALDMASPDDVVTVSDEAAGIEGSSMYLKAGQKITVRELLYGLMLQSGNDAAAALAIHCAGSVEAFATEMNRKAAELGMTGSNFTNPHGLSEDNHYSTARDMATLARAAMARPEFSAITSSKFAPVGEITIKNHNKMLWIYDGSDGVKTGYTINAGRCLVSSATRGDMRLIAVTLDDRDDWDDHTAMLNYGFENYALRVFCRQGETVVQRPVLGGESSFINIVPEKTLAVLLPHDKVEYARVDYSADRCFWAPVEQNQAVGRLTVTLDGREIGSAALLTDSAVGMGQAEEPGIWEKFSSFWKDLVS